MSYKDFSMAQDALNQNKPDDKPKTGPAQQPANQPKPEPAEVEPAPKT